MRKCIPLLAILTLFLVPQAAAKQDNHGGEGSFVKQFVSVPVGRVINHDYFAVGQSIEISGTVNGDVYAAGGHILVDGTINGDLLIVGGKVTISGEVLQDVRVAGGQVTISGRIGRNVTVGGGSIELTQSAVTQGSLVAGGGNVHLAGIVEQNAIVGAGNFIVSNTINGHLKAVAGVIRLTSNARVARNFTYWSHRDASIDQQAKITGAVKKKPIPLDSLPDAKGLLAAFVGLSLLVKFASFISTLILGLLLIRLYPKLLQQSNIYLQQRPLNVLGMGVLISILTPILVFLLGMTIIGLPLALFLLAVFFIYLYLCRIFVIAWAGQRIFTWLGKAHYEKLAFFVGLLIYFFLSFFPIVGPLMIFFTILFGLGILIFIKKEYYWILRGQGRI